MNVAELFESKRDDHAALIRRFLAALSAARENMPSFAVEAAELKRELADKDTDVYETVLDIIRNPKTPFQKYLVSKTK